MKKIHLFLLIPLFSLFSLGLTTLFFLLSQTEEYTIRSHSFRIEILPFVGISLLFLFLLLGLWVAYSKVISMAFSLSLSHTLFRDFLSYIPLVFLFLLPLSISHYLDASDLSFRIELFSIAVLFAMFYIKFAGIHTLERGKLPPLKTWAAKISALPTKKKLLVLFIISVVLYNAGSALMVSSGIHFSGDEPHYLLITHSLFRDGDFDLSNNYARRDYTTYMPDHVRIAPHTAPGTQGRYSFHSPGVSFLLLPFYAFGSLFKGRLFLFIIRFGMSLFGALLGLQIFLFALQEWKKERIAFSLWALYSFTSPVFFLSIHVYPEIIIALFSFTVFRLLRHSESFTHFKLIALGFLISSFLWFHVLKYMFILIPLFLYALWVLMKKHRIGSNILYFLAFPFFITLSYFFFQFRLYGSLSLSSVSWRGTVTSQESLAYLRSLITDIPHRVRWETLAGYFLDQRDGLLLYAPLYFFAFLGCIEMIKKCPRFFIVLLLITSPYVLNQAFLTQRTGYAPQARPLVAVSWALAIMLGFFLAYCAKKIFSLLFSFSAFLSFVFVLILLKNPLALYQLTTRGETERAGTMFLHLSNLHLSLPKFLPSFLKTDNSAWIPNVVWMGGLVLFMASYLIVKRHKFSLKYSHHLVFAISGLFLFFFWIVLYPRTVLLYPTNTEFSSGHTATFYSLGRVARMVEPGKFVLPEDGRSYVFYFTSWREIDRFQIKFGSDGGEYAVDLKYFDEEFFRGTTNREVRSIILPSRPSYRLRNTNLYRISIFLEKKSGIPASENPYLFSISPVDQIS
jgi:hypothetical protein